LLDLTRSCLIASFQISKILNILQKKNFSKTHSPLKTDDLPFKKVE
jgi:hypothetical protein